MTQDEIPQQPTIRVTSGPAAGRSVQIDGELVVGREGVDLTIAEDAELSRRHAALRATPGGVLVEDLGSLNGTFVNETRISSATAVSPDDEIRIGASRLKLVLPAPRPADPTPIVDTERTRQRPVPQTPDATPIVDTETTRQRPAVVQTPSAAPILDVETTRQRPAVQSERTPVRPDPAAGSEEPLPPPPPPAEAEPPQEDSEPAPGGSVGLPSSVVLIIGLVAIMIAVGIVLASSVTSSESTHQFSATITATNLRPAQQGQVELAGRQSGGFLGEGATTIDQFTSAPGSTGAGSAGGAAGALLSARIIAHLPAGTLVSIVKGTVTPRPGGGQTTIGTGTITGGTSRYKHASGSYSLTATQTSAAGATIFTLRGSVRY
jgi:hypothetical protein